MAAEHRGTHAANRQPWSGRRKSGLIFSTVFWLQGVYYLATGVWPLVSIETFQQVTGRKTDHLITGRESDHWLVMTVGVLVTAIACALLLAAIRGAVSPEVILLAIASAIGLTAIDVIYVSRGVIARIYLVDAVIEIILLAGLIVGILWDRKPLQSSTQSDAARRNN